MKIKPLIWEKTCADYSLLRAQGIKHQYYICRYKCEDFYIRIYPSRPAHIGYDKIKTLEEAIEIANKHNQNIISQWLEPELAENRLVLNEKGYV